MTLLWVTILLFLLDIGHRTDMLRRCGVTKCVKIGAPYRRSCPTFSYLFVSFFLSF
jgi:hypothetical protein